MDILEGELLSLGAPGKLERSLNETPGVIFDEALNEFVLLSDFADSSDNFPGCRVTN